MRPHGGDGRGRLRPRVDLSAAGQAAMAPQVAMDADGNTHYVWVRWNGTNGIVQTRRRAADGTLGAVQDLSAAGGDALSAQVAVGPDGSAHFVWQRAVPIQALGYPITVQARRRAPTEAWARCRTSPTPTTTFEPPAGGRCGQQRPLRLGSISGRRYGQREGEGQAAGGGRVAGGRAGADGNGRHHSAGGGRCGRQRPLHLAGLRLADAAACGERDARARAGRVAVGADARWRSTRTAMPTSSGHGGWGQLDRSDATAGRERHAGSGTGRFGHRSERRRPPGGFRRGRQRQFAW